MFIKNLLFNGNIVVYWGGVVVFNVNGGVVNVIVCKINFINNLVLDGGVFFVNS